MDQFLCFKKEQRCDYSHITSHIEGIYTPLKTPSYLVSVKRLQVYFHWLFSSMKVYYISDRQLFYTFNKAKIKDLIAKEIG